MLYAQTIVKASYTCSAAMSLSKSGERSSSSLLCRTTVARPFSIICSATLLENHSLSRPSQTRVQGLRVVAAETDRYAFPFVVFAFLWADKIDVTANILANDLLPKELR